MKTEDQEVNLDQVNPHVVHPGLHQDYDLDFQMQRVDDIALTLTSPLLLGLIKSVCHMGAPKVPRRPTSPQAEEEQWGHSGAPTRPDTPCPSHVNEPGATEGDKPLEPGEANLKETLPTFNPEDAVAVIILDDDELDLPTGGHKAAPTLKTEPAWGQK